MPARGGRVDAQGNYHQKPTVFTKCFPLAFVFILLGLFLCTLTSVEAGIDLHLCVSWQPVYAGPSVCATSGEVGGCMMVKLVVIWSAPVISVSNGWIEVKENAGHQNQYAKWEQQCGSSPPADAPRRVPEQNTTVFQQTVPVHWWINQHNGPWTIKGGCSYVVQLPPPPYPPPRETRQAEAPPITVSLRELTVWNVSPEYLFWDPENPDPNKLTIQYSLDSVQQTPVNVTIKILPLSDNQNPDPIKTVIESRTSPGGPYTYTWDGTMDTSVPPGQPAPKGIYPFEISVAQPAPPYQQDQKTSAYLTISDTATKMVQNLGAHQLKIQLDYTLSHSRGRPASVCEVKVYNTDFTEVYSNAGLPKDLGSHTVYFPVTMDRGGYYWFVVSAADSDEDAEKAHRTKRALEKGADLYMPRASNYDNSEFTTQDASTAKAYQDPLPDGTFYSAYAFTNLGNLGNDINGVRAAKKRIREDTIVFVANHAQPGWIQLTGQGASSAVGWSGKVDDAESVRIDNANWIKVRFACFAGCKTGLSDDYYGDLLTAAVNGWAAAAMGFKEEIDSSYHWSDAFWRCACGWSGPPPYPSVLQAAIYARDEMVRIYGNSGGYESFRFEGDSSLCLVPAFWINP